MQESESAGIRKSAEYGDLESIPRLDHRCPNVVFSPFGPPIGARREVNVLFASSGPPATRLSCFPVWTALCPNAVLSPFGPSVCDRLGGLLGCLAAIWGPFGSLRDRPRALSLSEALLGLGALLGDSWGPLGALLGLSWGHLRALLGRFGLFWVRLGALLGRFGGLLGPSLPVLELFWAQTSRARRRDKPPTRRTKPRRLWQFGVRAVKRLLRTGD